MLLTFPKGTHEYSQLLLRLSNLYSGSLCPAVGNRLTTQLANRFLPQEKEIQQPTNTVTALPTLTSAIGRMQLMAVSINGLKKYRW